MNKATKLFFQGVLSSIIVAIIFDIVGNFDWYILFVPLALIPIMFFFDAWDEFKATLAQKE